jgi:hypothetical protein
MFAFGWLPMSVYTCIRTEMLPIKIPLRYPGGKQRAIAKKDSIIFGCNLRKIYRH